MAMETDPSPPPTPLEILFKSVLESLTHALHSSPGPSPARRSRLQFLQTHLQTLIHTTQEIKQLTDALENLILPLLQAPNNVNPTLTHPLMSARDSLSELVAVSRRLVNRCETALGEYRDRELQKAPEGFCQAASYQLELAGEPLEMCAKVLRRVDAWCREWEFDKVVAVTELIQILGGWKFVF
ncbi:hypothetical protein RUND412_001385 [Rhizina undulata]